MDLTDEDLVERIRAGESALFAEIVKRHTGRAYAIGLSMLRNEQDARDVVQETFLNAYRRLDSFRGDAPLGGWLARIATNNALMKLRTRRRKPESPLEIKGPDFDGSGAHERQIVDWRPIAEQNALDAELGQRIRAAVDELPEKYRTVLLLADYREMSMKQIAAALDLTVPNVKTRLHRARLSVRNALSVYLAAKD